MSVFYKVLFSASGNHCSSPPPQRGADIGEPSYKAISGSSWQLQEVTATFLAHCPTAVKWHMLPQPLSQQQKCTCLHGIPRAAKRKARAVRLAKSEAVTSQPSQIVTGEVRNMAHGEEIYFIRVGARPCTCTMNARIDATKYAQSQTLSCCSCQQHLCSRGHTGARTMELYETEAPSRSPTPHEAPCCHFHVGP